jgi:CRISPR/Cas system-associated endoribonuclease Cas2
MNVIDTFIEVDLNHEEDFLKIKETLTRIGVASKKDRTLYQSCHILHKQGKYYIVHFKELFMLDGKPSNFSDDDRLRRNTIANLLEQWGLLKIKNNVFAEQLAPIGQIKIISHKEKDDWELVAKYNIGRRK